MELSTPIGATKNVDGSVARRRNDPPSRIGWDPVARPPLASHHEGILDRVFSETYVAEDTHQGCDSLAVGLTEDLFDLGSFLVAAAAQGPQASGILCI